MYLRSIPTAIVSATADRPLSTTPLISLDANIAITPTTLPSTARGNPAAQITSVLASQARSLTQSSLMLLVTDARPDFAMRPVSSGTQSGGLHIFSYRPAVA